MSIQVTIPSLIPDKQLGTTTKLVTCKTAPNMSLNELINQLVQDHNLGNPTQYNLKYQNKWLDRTLIFRLANLPRLAKLELKKVEHFVKKSVDVNIALQLKDGQRLTKKIKLSTSLWNILVLFQLENSNINFLKLQENGFWLQPTAQLLNREISDLETLKSTTLEGLGVTSGSILIRVNYKKTELALDQIDQLFSIEEEISSQVQTTPTSAQTIDPVETNNLQNVSKENNPQNNSILNHSTSPSSLNQASSIAGADESKSPKPISQSSSEPTKYSNFRVFRPLPDGINISSRLQIPDEFYQFNPQELKQLVMSQQKALQKLVDGGPLKTSNMRQKELEAKMKKYPKTLIRLRLPNFYQIQFGLLTTDSISKLYETVKSIILDTERPFQLYTMPPFKLLKPESGNNCFDEGLTPASIVHFKWAADSPTDSLDPIIREDLMALAEDIEIPSPTFEMAPKSSPKDPAALLGRLTNTRDQHQRDQPQRDHYDEDREPSDGSSSSKKSSKDPVKDKLKKFLRL